MFLPPPLPLLTGLLAAIPLLALGQSGDAAPAQQVEVNGKGTLQERRAAIEARLVVSRDELLRQGDTNLADALRRVPGISVTTTGGRGAEIRMSGLGGGYTQLLLNGEPVPPGFALESLSPELIERVEVSRSPNVDQSAQAIAGSVNIVLRRTARSSQRDLKLGAGQVLGRPSANVDAQLGDRDGLLAWGLGLGAAMEDQVWPMALSLRVTDDAGQLSQAYTTDKREFDRTETLSLTPRLSWAFDDADSLSTDHLLRLRRSSFGALDRRESSAGEAPVFGRDDLRAVIDAVQWRGRLNWTRKLAEGAQLEAKLGGTYLRSLGEADFDAWSSTGQYLRDEHVHSLAVDQGLSWAGKYLQPLGAEHSALIGWDGAYNQRDENRIQREQPIDGGLPVENLDEVYQARVTRLALFAQDEWSINSEWTASLGLRWEGLQTSSRSDAFDGVVREMDHVGHDSGVVSPVLRAVWRLPQSKDQVRIGLGRTYKAPTTRELMPRRYVANVNSPTTPDMQGNPNLRPELAWGLDLAYERYLGKAGMWGLSSYAKRIDDVILDELILQEVGAETHWVQRRSNQGVAWVAGIEAELKLELATLWAWAPPVEARANLGLNRSRVDAVPGPDNRLARQTPLVLNLGADYRPTGVAWSAGGNFNLQGGGDVRTSATRRANLPTKRLLDLYAQWKPDAASQWRLALNNLLHQDEVTGTVVRADELDYAQRESLRTGTALRLSWETKL
jgi:outer membrane receptor protein involved in Fe transport